MIGEALGPVSAACRGRLAQHYGVAVDGWLAAIPARLAEVAARWGLTLVGYHDAGCASVLAVAETPAGYPVLLKAWYSRTRYMREVVGLQAWAGGPVPRLLRCADDSSIAMMQLIGGRPGGCQPPQHDQDLVAEALQDLHGMARDVAGLAVLPSLNGYLAGTLFPRVDRRLRTVGVDVRDPYRVALARLEPQQEHGGRPSVLLHADLYRENIMFARGARPVFIDPLPMVGDPVFDWAFWTVYYDLASDPMARLRLAARASRISATDLAAWCLLLCVDGLCYYREVGDSRQRRMADVLAAVAAVCCETGS